MSEIAKRQAETAVGQPDGFVSWIEKKGQVKGYEKAMDQGLYQNEDMSLLGAIARGGLTGSSNR